MNGELKDSRQRRLIEEDLDSTIMVEAAAGTGKTTAMTARMTSLISEGRCRIEEMAAVTFTRKAASEMRSRFRLRLEQAERDSEGKRLERIRTALEGFPGCFVGTIHSFCAGLLRERPIEAGVDVDFEEIDEDRDKSLRERAWREYSARLFTSENSGIIEELRELGLEVSDLYDAFIHFCEYPDVDVWRGGRDKLPDTADAARELEKYAAHLARLIPKIPEDTRSDKMIPVAKRVVNMVRFADLSSPPELMEVLEQFLRHRDINIVKSIYPEGKGQAEAEKARWTEFKEETAEPVVTDWYEYRYQRIINVIKAAVEHYDALRAESGRLNYLDLLMKAADLLRDRPHLRRYFRKRFTHVLVDEFQDTDPVQAEVMMLLTADNPEERDWRKCVPEGGSLFVVGDPKQSIYRFRRADIVTYNRVRGIIEAAGGEIVNLSSNFRTRPRTIDWINGVFSERFPKEHTEQSPAYVEMVPALEGEDKPLFDGVRFIETPAGLRKSEDIAGADAERTAGIIHGAVERGIEIPGKDGPAEPGDFMIITKKKARLGIYAEALRRRGVPYTVTGGGVLNESEEPELLHRCLKAVNEPDNPVPLLAVLRSPLFGINDEILYFYKKAGGQFCYRRSPSDEVEPDIRKIFDDAFDRLNRYSVWIDCLPAVAAVEQIIDDLGLALLAGSRKDGKDRAGNLYKVVELLRSRRAEHTTFAALVDYIGDLIDKDEEHDSLPITGSPDSAVRIMNLHKAKGLEAPVVFLADPSGDSDYPPEIHIDRSGNETAGYLVLSRRVNEWVKTTLARPKNWEEFQFRERAFDEAENLRLLYVAATRTGASLIISRRGKPSARNPWSVLLEKLDCDCEFPALEAGEKREMDQPPPRTIEIEENLCDLEARRRRLFKPTYRVQAVKRDTVTEKPPYSKGAEKGLERGGVIHKLLESALKSPDTDIENAAEKLCAEYGLGPIQKDNILTLIRKAVRSDLWKRVLASEKYLTEVPVQTAEERDGEPLNILLGVIDLVFKEENKWVIVDYKSDDRPGRPVDSLVEMYRPQVETYGRMWEKNTGEPVGEKGLFFVNTCTYVRL